MQLTGFNCFTISACDDSSTRFTTSQIMSSIRSSRLSKVINGNSAST